MEEPGEEMELAMSIASAINAEEAVTKIDLNEDNSMTWHTTVEGDSTCSETILTGTYEVTSDNTIRLNINEKTHRATFCGVTQSETENKSETREYNYLLSKNKLTLLNNEGGKLPLRRS